MFVEPLLKSMDTEPRSPGDSRSGESVALATCSSQAASSFFWLELRNALADVFPCFRRSNKKDDDAAFRRDYLNLTGQSLRGSPGLRGSVSMLLRSGSTNTASHDEEAQQNP